MPRTLLIADTHFSHKAIIDYCSRSFSSVEEMNETMIENWNRVVRKDDNVFVLGDFALCGKDKIIEIGNRLRGRKTLILGNHDGASINTYREAGFELVYKHPIVFKEFFILSHYPQFTVENGLYANIYGHIHNDPKYKDYTARTFCVSVERINYTPIDFEEVYELMKGCEYGN